MSPVLLPSSALTCPLCSALLCGAVDPFPYAQAIDSDMSPSTNLVRDREEYDAWT